MHDRRDAQGPLLHHLGLPGLHSREYSRALRAEGAPGRRPGALEGALAGALREPRRLHVSPRLQEWRRAEKPGSPDHSDAAGRIPGYLRLRPTVLARPAPPKTTRDGNP